jgi:hypothetical protein
MITPKFPALDKDRTFRVVLAIRLRASRTSELSEIIIDDWIRRQLGSRDHPVAGRESYWEYFSSLPSIKLIDSTCLALEFSGRPWHDGQWKSWVIPFAMIMSERLDGVHPWCTTIANATDLEAALRRLEQKKCTCWTT